MVAEEAGSPIKTLQVVKEVLIAAPADVVFQTILQPHGPTKDMNMKLEPWPGGRWFRDLGNNTGHLWGHVQVIKPPVLLELSGPMFMSYPALNHVEIKLDQIAGGTKVTLRHRSIGLLEEAHRQNIGGGWKHYLDNIRKDVS